MRIIGTIVNRMMRAAAFRPQRFDIVIFGEQCDDWLPLLAEGSELWHGLTTVRSVTQVGDDWRPAVSRWSAYCRRLVIPLLEVNTMNVPKPCWGLFPSNRAVAIFSDKARFAQFATRHGLHGLVPRTFKKPTAVRYPCVVKRTDLFGGAGVAIAQTREALDTFLSSEPWAGCPVIIQKYLPGPEWTGHVIASGGRVLWHRAYRHVSHPDQPIRHPVPGETTDPVTLSATDIADIERFLVPVAYDGPANIDFKRGADGRLRIMEINPRLGGSLFRAQNSDDLKSAFETLIANAKWRPAPR